MSTPNSFFDASAAAANNTTDEAQDMFEDFSEEVRNIINEMGYDVEEDVLHEIEKDLRLLEENADVADRKLFSCLLDNFDGFPTSASDLDLSLQNLTNMVATSSQQAGQSEIPREFDELITHGYERLQEVYMDIKRYERLLEEGQTGPGTMRNRQREDAQNEDVEDEEDEDDGSLPSSQQEFARKHRQQPSEKEKENVRFVDEEPVKIDPKKEKQLINRFLRANALRATKCPEPGRLPFKHDHQLRLEQYCREWAKLPPPGEQKRMALRWRIRELMLQREIPHLRLISEDAIQVEVEEQPPVVKMTRKSHWKP